MGQVRRGERRWRPELAASKYLWLKRPERLSGRQAERLAWLTRPSSRLATARAYRWRWDFDGFYDQPAETAKAYLARWCRGASRSRLEPIKRFVAMVDRHWDGIVGWHANQVSNGSVGSLTALCAVSAAEVVDEWGFLAACGVALAVGLTGGLVNGVIHWLEGGDQSVHRHTRHADGLPGAGADRH